MKKTTPSVKPPSRPAFFCDILWKAILMDLLLDFLEMCHPQLYRLIDRNKPIEFQDKEFPRLHSRLRSKHRHADIMVKVWLKTGELVALIVHIEAQGYPEPLIATPPMPRTYSAMIVLMRQEHEAAMKKEALMREEMQQQLEKWKLQAKTEIFQAQKAEAERLELEKRAKAERLELEKRAEAERLELERKAEAERTRLEQKAEAEKIKAIRLLLTANVAVDEICKAFDVTEDFINTIRQDK